MPRTLFRPPPASTQLLFYPSPIISPCHFRSLSTMPKKRPSTDGSGRAVTKKAKISRTTMARQKATQSNEPEFNFPTAGVSAGSLPSTFSEMMNLVGNAKFYQSGTGPNIVPMVQQNLGKIFDQYRDQPKTAPDKIDIDGAQRYLTDLNVELDEVAHLALCDFLQCPSIGEFDREPFISGWRSLNPRLSTSPASQSFDTLARQSSYIHSLRKKLSSDPTYFKQVYRNAFKLAKPENQKSVPMDSALDFWNMFFREGKGGIEWNSGRTKWLDLWLEFYESHNKRPVNKDLWNMVGELVLKTKEPDGEDLAWWKEDGAWPMAVDDFVSFVKDKRKEEGESMDVS